MEKSLTKALVMMKENKQVFKMAGPVKVCLFINVSDISLKLFNGRKFRKKYKAIVYDSNESRITVTEYLEKFNIKCIVLETSNITHLHKNIANEIVTARNKGIAVYDAHEFYEHVNKRIPLIRLETNEYLVDDIFTIGQKQEKFNVKRFIDILVSVLLLPVVIPLIILGFILVKLTSSGSVLFSQERVGKNSKNFTIYKIRTMVSKHSGDFTTKNDLRINGVGKFLRLTKIDELPQLWNILKGDMSLIGPRPERPHFVKISNDENAMFDLRHLIKPGVTGWAQVNLPTATPKDNLEKLEYDLFYIKNYSFLFDIIIVFKTLKIVFTLNSN
ncbi:sugar transferase [Chryseobacterium aquaticum]|uniref:Sugar transferase n=2 Tax=Chryseobacterium TaxID=59732 RepID=A0A848NBL5_9FLAO|nr:sugar transferase [Chryseobacterium aquaticum]NMR35759.1 sugar transferase [Chryseobacterium aquaticum]NRQ47794.1 sugar transferase [Chryseobacterium sp. C-204]